MILCLKAGEDGRNTPQHCMLECIPCNLQSPSAGKLRRSNKTNGLLQLCAVPVTMAAIVSSSFVASTTADALSFFSSELGGTLLDAAATTTRKLRLLPPPELETLLKQLPP